MASRDDDDDDRDDDRDERRRPPRRRDRDDDDDDDRGSRSRGRDRDGDRDRDRDDDDDRDRERDRPRRRRREREYDDEDYEPRPAGPSHSEMVGNELGLALGITGLVCGASALSFSFIPCFGMWALWPAIISAVISLIGLIVSTRMKALSIAALIVSLAAVGFAVHQRMHVEQVVDDLQRIGKAR